MKKFNVLCGLIWMVFALTAAYKGQELWLAVGIICNQIWLSKD